MREQTIKKGFDKAKSIYNKMNNNTDIGNTTENVKITKKLYLEINCIRNCDNEAPSSGSPLCFEVYAIVDGKTVDGVTIDGFCSTFDDDVMYLLNCYV